jgi:F0F1-type ATP synthase delta subunit
MKDSGNLFFIEVIIMTTRKELIDDLIKTLQDIKKSSHPMTEAHLTATEKLSELGIGENDSLESFQEAV